MTTNKFDTGGLYPEPSARHRFGKRKAARTAHRPVHNHEPRFGREACRETLVEGSLVGDCLRFEEDDKQ